MQNRLTEIQVPEKEAVELAREQISKVPEIRLSGFEQLTDIWALNHRGWNKFSSVKIEPHSAQIFDWVREVCQQEGIQGSYSFLLPLRYPPIRHKAIWIQADFDSFYEWIKPLWELTQGELSFSSLDHTYRLYITFDLDTWEHYATHKTRKENEPRFKPGVMPTENVVRVKCLDEDFAIFGGSNGDAQIWSIKDKETIHYLEGYSEFANSIKIGDRTALACPMFYGDRLYLWDFTTGEILQKTTRYKEINGINR